MEKLLLLLARECSFLYRELGFRIVDSEFGGSFGDDAWVILSNDKVRLRLDSDRGQIFLDVQRSPRRRKEPWYPINAVRKLVLAQAFPPAGLNDETLAFLRSHFAEIEQRFTKSYAETTKELTKILRAHRAAPVGTKRGSGK